MSSTSGHAPKRALVPYTCVSTDVQATTECSLAQKRSAFPCPYPEARAAVADCLMELEQSSY